MNADTAQIISSYLSFINKFKIKLLCKNYSAIKIDFKLEFKNRIKKFIENPDEFCNKLKKYNAHIAGSFILDVVYNTNYSNDIDVYESGSCASFNENNEINNIPFMQYIYTLNLCATNHSRYSRCHDNEYSGIISKIRDFQIKNGPKLQHICVKSNKIRTFINNSFDLDICKCCFDGNKLYIKNIDKIFGKYDFIKPMYPLITHYYNESYCTRNDKSTLMTVTNARMNKYKNRGFGIKYHPKFDEILDYIMRERYHESRKETCWRNDYTMVNTLDIIMNGVPFD